MNKNTLQALSLLMAGAVFLQGVPLTAAGAKAKIKEKKIILSHKGATKKITIRNTFHDAGGHSYTVSITFAIPNTNWACRL